MGNIDDSKLSFALERISNIKRELEALEDEIRGMMSGSVVPQDDEPVEMIDESPIDISIPGIEPVSAAAAVEIPVAASAEEAAGSGAVPEAGQEADIAEEPAVVEEPEAAAEPVIADEPEPETAMEAVEPAATDEPEPAIVEEPAVAEEPENGLEVSDLPDDIPSEMPSDSLTEEDLPSEAAADLPTEDLPATDTPAIDTPAADLPSDDLPFDDDLPADDVFGAAVPAAEEPKEEKPSRKKKALIDAQNAGGAVMDVMAEKQAWRVDRPGTQVKNIISAISLNDRVLLINVLFREDPMLFQNTIAAFNAMASLDEAVAYVQTNFPEWNMNSEPVYRLMMAVRRKLQ